MHIQSAALWIQNFHGCLLPPREVRMHKSRKSPSRALLRREGDSLLFFMASRVKLIHGLLAPLRPTTTYVHGSVSLPRFHSPLCSKEHVELI